MTSHQNWVAFTTIVKKEVNRFMRIWSQTLLPPLITQTLYFVIFGKFIGAQIGGINGITYMQFIVPGLVMMSIINNSFANVVGSFFSAKFQRSIEELLVSSSPNWVILAGYVVGGTLRGLFVGIIVFIVSIFFTLPHILHFSIILLFTLLTCVLFSIGGLINAVFAKKFDDISIFPTFFLTPLTYFGGVFYSIHSLPPVFQKLSLLNPILYIINGFRYGFYGISDVNVGISLLILTLLVIACTFIAHYLLEKGIGLKN